MRLERAQTGEGDRRRLLAEIKDSAWRPVTPWSVLALLEETGRW